MSLGLGLGLALQAGTFARGPAFVGFASSTSGNPTTPTGSVGDLLIAVGPRNSQTPATEDTATWTLWSTEAHATASLSVAIYWKVATGSAAASDPVTWTNSNNMRCTWRFTRAAIDTLNFSQGASSTTIDYEAQPTMVAQSLLGIYVIVPTAQTDIATALAGGGTTLGNLGITTRASRNSSLAGWAGDGAGNRFDSFDPANSTLDTASTKIVGVFSVKAST